MENAKKNQILTIPNFLSLLRLLMIPFIVYLYKKSKFLQSALWIFISGATDVVDGFIARRFNMISDVGKVLDPIADKLTQAAVLICLLDRFEYMIVPFVLLAIKEIFAIIWGLLVIRKKGEVHSSVWHGKLSTVLLYAMMFLHLVWSDIPKVASNISIGVCTFMILLSFVLYGRLNMGYLRGEPENK